MYLKIKGVVGWKNNAMPSFTDFSQSQNSNQEQYKNYTQIVCFPRSWSILVLWKLEFINI